jgi:hypothetical protein
MREGVYVSGPAAAGASPPGWGIARIVRRRFPQPAQRDRDEAHTARLTTYLGDMVRPYQLRLDADAVRHGGQSYGEMAAEVMAEIVAPGERIDVLVLAYAIPDVTPGRATATYLSHICPGNPLAFAISDQGRAAAFTGLRLLREYARSGGSERGLLIVVEQAGLPYDPGLPVEVPTGHTAVALRCDATTAAAPVTSIDIRADVDASTLRSEWEHLIGPLPDARTGAASLIVGASLAGYAPGGVATRVGPAGAPTTGIWWELAAALGARRDDRMLIADYDADLGYLCHATVETVRATAPPPSPAVNELIAG